MECFSFDYNNTFSFNIQLLIIFYRLFLFRLEYNFIEINTYPLSIEFN